MFEVRVRDARTTLRWCGDCVEETVFEAPPCQDGHGDDCLDVMCTQCGAGVVLGLQGAGPDELTQAA